MSTLAEILNATSIISNDVLREKYCKGNEASIEDVCIRVATGLAEIESPETRADWIVKYYDHLQHSGVGAGRIMSACGTGVSATLANCFVQGVGDTFDAFDEFGNPGIIRAVEQAVRTMSKGGGEGYNFSNIRPKKAYVKGTHSITSGVCSFIDIFDTAGRMVESAGNRRGAQMGILDVDHPDIYEFIEAKRQPGRWTGFNVSVNIPDKFMEAVLTDSDWELAHKAVPHSDYMSDCYQRDDDKWVYRKVKAKDLFDKIMQSTYDHAEPGVLFPDEVNRQNPLYYCEYLNATNPCAEQNLPPYGCCDLGPLILTRFVENPFTEFASFNIERFEAAVATQVRILDNVLDITLWPLEEQRVEAMYKRRIGVGYTGFGDTLIMLNIRYDSDVASQLAGIIAKSMRDAAYMASVELAKERGSFPLLDVERYLSGAFISRLPESIKDAIRVNGIRNSHLLSIAPTGTVSLAFADNASNGIEPAFSWVYSRRKVGPDGKFQVYQVMDYAFKIYIRDVLSKRETEEYCVGFVQAVSEGNSEYLGKKIKDILPPAFVTALEINVDAHLAPLFITQKYICASQSKTVNCPEDYPFEDFKEVYMKAWRGGLKGISTYRPNPIRPGILTVPSEAKKEEVKPVADAHTRDILNEAIPSLEAGDLPAIKTKAILDINYEKQNIHIAVSFKEMVGELNGRVFKVLRPVEFFVPQSQVDESPQWVSATMRALSLLAREGKAFARALSDNRNIRWNRAQVRCGSVTKADGTIVPRFHSSDVAAISWIIQDLLIRQGYLKDNGEVKDLEDMAVFIDREKSEDTPVNKLASEPVQSRTMMAGKVCKTCGAAAVVKRDGCEICTNCGELGTCG